VILQRHAARRLREEAQACRRRCTSPASHARNPMGCCCCGGGGGGGGGGSNSGGGQSGTAFFATKSWFSVGPTFDTINTTEIGFTLCSGPPFSPLTLETPSACRRRRRSSSSFHPNFAAAADSCDNVSRYHRDTLYLVLQWHFASASS